MDLLKHGFHLVSGKNFIRFLTNPYYFLIHNLEAVMIATEQAKKIRFGYIEYSVPSNEVVMALITVGQLLPVPYKDSAAGSNPREFQGMKSTTNKKILESLLRNPKIFWALHSGVTVTVTAGDNIDELLEYEDACLTNGLQTITIVRILAMIKAIS